MPIELSEADICSAKVQVDQKLECGAQATRSKVECEARTLPRHKKQRPFWLGHGSPHGRAIGFAVVLRGKQHDESRSGRCRAWLAVHIRASVCAKEVVPGGLPKDLRICQREKLVHAEVRAELQYVAVQVVQVTRKRPRHS